MSLAKGRPKSRGKAIAAACGGAWPDAIPMVTAIIDESKHFAAWRPIRAAVLHAQADAGERVWMTLEELAEWRRRQRVIDRMDRLPAGAFDAAVGLTRDKLRDLNRGRTPEVRKMTALACAHYAMRLPLPVPAGDAEALSRWCADRFGATRAVYEWLEVGRDAFSDALRGYRITKGRKTLCPPTEALIRALDWLDRMGPVCPYGQRQIVNALPSKQES